MRQNINLKKLFINIFFLLFIVIVYFLLTYIGFSLIAYIIMGSYLVSINIFAINKGLNVKNNNLYFIPIIGTFFLIFYISKR